MKIRENLNTRKLPDLQYFAGDPFNPLPAKVSDLNSHPLEVVSRYRDPQLQVSENYSWLFNLRVKLSICLYSPSN